MAQRRTKPEAPEALPASATISSASWGMPREDFRVPGPHGLVVFHAGRRVLVEPQVRALMGRAAPIEWED